MVKGSCKYVRKINQNGRSIPEMLGVLAIVGILSVGGIAGYGRAMMKYKLNKQLTQYTAIITGSYQLAQLRDAAGNKNVNLTRFMINSGVVPSEMIKPGFPTTSGTPWAIKSTLA